MSCWPLSLPAICETRPVISAAARSERVINRIRLGSAPLRMRCASRALGIGFARSRTGDDEKSWPDRAILPHAVLGGTALVGIEFTQDVSRLSARLAPAERIDAPALKTTFHFSLQAP